VVLDDFVCGVFIFGKNRDLVERKLGILLEKKFMGLVGFGLICGT
jgi:hypothetical protein